MRVEWQNSTPRFIRCIVIQKSYSIDMSIDLVVSIILMSHGEFVGFYEIEHIVTILH